MTSNYTNNQEPTLWSTYHDIKAVLEAPAIEKRQVQVLVDDSIRIVDMTLIQPNLYIGAELVFLLLCYISKYTYNCTVFENHRIVSFNIETEDKAS